jgi:G3E family GTPase
MMTNPTLGTSALERIPVTVLTGFLGAGKTTLLSHLVRQPELTDAAVIINEFGEVSLDHELVERIDGDVIEIKGGCLCCTVRSDLLDTLRGLLTKRIAGKVKAFDRVVIETTGLADPAPILQTLMSDPMAFDKFRLDGIVTVVDAVNGLATLDAHPEALKQAAVADRILLTKTDLAEEASLAPLLERLRGLNPGAGVTHVALGRVAPATVLDLGPFDPKGKVAQVEEWLRAEAYAAHDHDHHGHSHDAHDVNRHNDSIRAFCLIREKPVKIESLQFLLQLIAALRGPDILRVKGIVHAADQPDTPAVIHGVQHVFHPVTWLSRWPNADRRTRIVFIVRDMTEEQIAEFMASLDDADVNEAAASGA